MFWKFISSVALLNQRNKNTPSSHLQFLFILTFTVLLPLTGCGMLPNPMENTPAPSPTPVETNTDTPTAATLRYAEGWNEIIIFANSARTTVTIGGHFITSRNACGRDAYGSLQLEVWNDLASQINEATKLSMVEEPFCLDPPDEYPFMDGTVEIKVNEKNLEFFRYEGGMICTNLSDKEVASAVLKAIQKVIPIADREDCANGWGSP